MELKTLGTIAEINLTNLIDNYQAICRKVAPAVIMAVVKADAYGHGAIPVSLRLQENGVKYFVVGRLSEALEIKNAGISENILILGCLFREEIDEAISKDIQITLTDEENFYDAEVVALRRKKRAFVHIKVDTGMGRVGFRPEVAPEMILKVLENRNFSIKGICSHFASADSRDKTFAYEQLNRFRKVIDRLRAVEAQLPLFHMANSGAILDMPEAYFDMVRPGISLYGHYPTSETTESISLKQVMTLKTKVSQIRSLPRGTPVSYGCRYMTSADTNVAVLPIGYADGIHRTFSNKGQVMIHGKLYPMIGAVTMDQIMIDIGNAPIRKGEDVILWGNSPEGELQATKVAENVGTISYELCCSVSKRVPRVYIG